MLNSLRIIMVSKNYVFFLETQKRKGARLTNVFGEVPSSMCREEDDSYRSGSDV